MKAPIYKINLTNLDTDSGGSEIGRSPDLESGYECFYWHPAIICKLAFLDIIEMPYQGHLYPLGENPGGQTLSFASAGNRTRFACVTGGH
jgi:hypothetical protein